MPEPEPRPLTEEEIGALAVKHGRFEVMGRAVRLVDVGATISSLKARLAEAERERNELLKELSGDGSKSGSCLTCRRTVRLWNFKWMDPANGFECFGCRKVFCRDCAVKHFAGPPSASISDFVVLKEMAEHRAEAAEARLDECIEACMREHPEVAALKARAKEAKRDIESIMDGKCLPPRSPTAPTGPYSWWYFEARVKEAEGLLRESQETLDCPWPVGLATRIDAFLSSAAPEGESGAAGKGT